MNPNENSEKETSKVQKIKNLCIEQNKLFRQWASEQDWRRFHDQHYDWWAFPIDRPSSRGEQFQLSKDDILVLKKDPLFVKILAQNAILASRAWGWDLQKGQQIEKRGSDQQWQDWPIRLKKICHSLELFQQKALFCNGIKYGNILLDKCGEFFYGKRNLTDYFRSKKLVQTKVEINQKKY